MFQNMMPNWKNNNFNNFNNCNNCNNFNNIQMNMNMGFDPNQNMNMQGVNIGGWQGIYNTAIQNQNKNMFSKPEKFNAIFRTTKGIRHIIMIDFNKTVSDLIKIYLTRVERPDLFDNPQDVFFICNAKRINNNEQRTIEQYFRDYNGFITVNDTKGLIGA